MAGDFNMVAHNNQFPKLPGLKPSQLPFSAADVPPEIVALCERRGLQGDAFSPILPPPRAMCSPIRAMCSPL